MANSFQIGDLDVLVVSDGFIRFPPTVYYAGTTREQWEPHRRWLDHEGNIEFSLGCFLVRSGDRRVLIDTGLGSAALWQFRGGALMGELAAAGVRPEEIDTVFVTHLHVDHCGTCALEGDGGLRPAFPKAVYRWTSDEHAHWLSAPQPPGSSFSVSALQQALSERFEAAEDGAALAAGVNVIATPGHTPGHAGVVLSSGGERAFILGDAISCPVQLEEPEWSGMGDIDPKLARRTQEAVAKEIEGSGALLATSHFPGLTFGRVLRGEGRRYWQPL
ncbi:MAG: MBL fold metallo-hydrolase [Dehalococcoidia bacterium]|nr:MBL fold metallo-hydrolase [Dehalococcoidia bacterium]